MSKRVIFVVADVVKDIDEAGDKLMPIDEVEIVYPSAKPITIHPYSL